MQKHQYYGIVKSPPLVRFIPIIAHGAFNQ